MLTQGDLFNSSELFTSEDPTFHVNPLQKTQWLEIFTTGGFPEGPFDPKLNA